MGFCSRHREIVDSLEVMWFSHGLWSALGFMSSQGLAVYFSHTLAMLRCGRRVALKLICLKTVPGAAGRWAGELETWPRFAGYLNASLQKEGHSWHMLHAVRILLPGPRLARGTSSGTFHLFHQGKRDWIYCQVIASCTISEFIEGTYSWLPNILRFGLLELLLCMLSRVPWVTTCGKAKEAGNGDGPLYKSLPLWTSVPSNKNIMWAHE